MKRCCVVFCPLLWTTLVGYAACYIQMPGEAVLEERLYANDFSIFADKTGIARKIGGKRLASCVVVVKIRRAYHSYREQAKEGGWLEPLIEYDATEIERRSSDLFKLFFQDYPAILAQLKRGKQHQSGALSLAGQEDDYHRFPK